MSPSLIEIGLKTADQNSAQTNRQTDRHYENNGHLAVNQHSGRRCEMRQRTENKAGDGGGENTAGTQQKTVFDVELPLRNPAQYDSEHGSQLTNHQRLRLYTRPLWLSETSTTSNTLFQRPFSG